MFNKQILLNTSMEVEVGNIITEIKTYIEKESESGILSPKYYYHTLLFLSEILPYIEDQNKWIDLGYRICKDLKQNLEKYGTYDQTAMFGGLGYQCFAVNAFCKQGNILKEFSHSLNKLLFIATDNKLKQIEHAPTYDSNYDMISGISGLLYYLLDCNYTQDEKCILVKCIEYLMEFTKDTKFLDQIVIKFHVLQTNQNPNFDQEDYKYGSINFGLAHGMLGPLIALAKAYSKGFIIDGLREGIEKIYQLYEKFKSVNEGNVPYWPRIITVEEYIKGVAKREHLHLPSSWCYGNVGIIRGLQKVASYMDWKELEQSYIEVQKHIYTQELKNFYLDSPSLCHGFSSLVAIQTCAYYDCEDPTLLSHLERNVRQVISAYRKSNEHELSLEDIHDEKNPVEGYLKDLSLLTGSTGVAITLLSLRGKIATGKLLMID